MKRTFTRLFGIFLRRGMRNATRRIRKINQKYAKPRVKMTKMVRVALFMLRMYLLFLVGILFFKFWTLIR